jgi:signal transduction histidine kinase
MRPLIPGLVEDLYSAGHKPFDLQVERLITFLRVALTAFAAAAFYDDPIRAGQETSAIIYLLGIYMLFGFAVALIPVLGHVRTGWQLPIHIVDVGMIALLMHFLERVSSPFILLYTFLLLGTTVRWGWRGAVLTTISLLGLEVLLVHSPGSSPTDPSVPIPNMIIRGGFIVVVGGMFAFFGAAQETTQQRLAELAAWPRPATSEIEAWGEFLNETLAHVASILRCPRVLVLWEQRDEPFLNLALWADGRCQQERKPADWFGDLTAAELNNVAYAITDVNSKKCNTCAGPVICEGPVHSNALQLQFRLTSVASAPIAGTSCQGRIFMLDKAEWGEDDLRLTGIIASRIANELDQYALRVELGDKIAGMERVRLARDLHDTILQSLIAASIHLKCLIDHVSGANRVIIDNVLQLLLDDQRRIRQLIGGPQQSPGQQHLVLLTKMHQLVHQNKNKWGCDISLSVTPDHATIPSELGDQLNFILAESIANAARHGQASQIDVTATKSSGRVRLRIKDNGRGLKIASGTYNEVALDGHNVGPVSLRTRVAELHGSLVLSTSPDGVDLNIELPA